MRGYYITVKRGDRTGWLFGPFLCHDMAIAWIEPARRVAYEIDPWSHFDAFGTSSITSDHNLPDGTLNKLWHKLYDPAHHDQVAGFFMGREDLLACIC